MIRHEFAPLAVAQLEGDFGRSDDVGEEYGGQHPVELGLLVSHRGEQVTEVDVGKAVAVGHHEAFVADVALDALDASGGEGVIAGVGDRHDPVGFEVGIVDLEAGAVTKGDGEVGVQGGVVEEVGLDLLTLVAGADDELGDALGRVDLHQVPQDGLAADLDHRLRPELGFLAQAGAQSTAENDNLHSRICRWPALAPALHPLSRRCSFS